MKTLTDKRIVLGVTGGIAAYKCAELVRRLRDAGAQVRVVMTRNAERFVGATTFQALSGLPVFNDAFTSDADAMEHISVARWADLVVIAPASADFIGQLAQGLAGDFLSTLCIATAAPLAIAPAMNQQMWGNAAVQANVATLRARGVALFGPSAGDQACGETGSGRLLEPSQLVEAIVGRLLPPADLNGLHVVITAGPTREAVDPVRFLSNHSSGKMGYALASAAQASGAMVTLISGPTHLPCPYLVERVDVMSALDMRAAVLEHVTDAHIFIAAAAVADYRVSEAPAHKIKKKNEELVLNLVRNPDILAEVSLAPARPYCVGFAAETQDLEQYALEKMTNKRLDMIAANWVGERGDSEGSGFNSDENALHVFYPEGSSLLRRAPKVTIARELIRLIAEKYHEKHPS